MTIQSAGLLDLPATALAVTASCLGISDKKSLALTCKAMPAIIRPLWISLQVDLASEELPPAALINFSGITTIVVVDSSTRLPVLATSTEPAFYDEDYGGYDYPNIMPLYTKTTLDRVCSAIRTILTAALTEKGERRELSLRMAVPGKKTGSVLRLLIESISPKLQHVAGVTLAAFSMLQVASSLFPGDSEAAGTSALNSSANLEVAVLRDYINKLVAHPGFPQTSLDSLVVNCLPSSSNTAELPHAMFSQAKNALDHISHLSSGGSPHYPFTSVDAGWFIPDGSLADIITKGTIAWSVNNRADQLRLDQYTRLHTLQLSVFNHLDHFYYNALGNVLAADIIPQINALPMLRELHLCFTSDEPCPCMAFPSFLLPELTHLVINKGYFLGNSFNSLTQFCKLRQLTVTLKYKERESWEIQIPHNYLSHLAPLTKLRDVKVSNLRMYGRQNVDSLTAITSLRLGELQLEPLQDLAHGQEELYILPDAPMPRLRELDLVFDLEWSLGSTSNFKKSDEVIDWVLQNGAITYSGIETMRLGVLNFPAPLDTKLFTVHLAAHLMDTRVHDLLSHAPSLKHLAIDQARVQDESVLNAAIEGGELGNALEEEVAIRTGGSRSVKWQREVRFNLVPFNVWRFNGNHNPSRQLAKAVAVHFEYSRNMD